MSWPGSWSDGAHPGSKHKLSTPTPAVNIKYVSAIPYVDTVYFTEPWRYASTPPSGRACAEPRPAAPAEIDDKLRRREGRAVPDSAPEVPPPDHPPHARTRLTGAVREPELSSWQSRWARRPPPQTARPGPSSAVLPSIYFLHGDSLNCEHLAVTTV